MVSMKSVFCYFCLFICGYILSLLVFFFFNDTATTEIYTLSLHDALPISFTRSRRAPAGNWWSVELPGSARSEEHTSELQSQSNIVCRLLLEKKNKKNICLIYKNMKKKKSTNAMMPQRY